MTPRPAATLIVVRPGHEAPEVLMLERPARGLFGGLWVFPGGALEPIDGGNLARSAVAVPDDADDLIWRAAALRETVEEVGLAVTDPLVDEAIDAMGEDVFTAVRDRDAVLDGRRLRLLSQWVTPRGLPTRYDARFYLTSVPSAPALLPRAEEVVDLGWFTASEGLARVERGMWSMARPTLHHLRWLAGHSDVEAMVSAAAQASAQRVEPMMESDGSEVRVRLPAAAELP